MDSNEARDDEVAVVSDGPYSDQAHFTKDRQPCQHVVTQFFTGWTLFITRYQQCQKTKGTISIT